MNQELLKARLRIALKDHPEVALVYLFGSQIGGSTGPQSDYDLGVLINQAEDVEFLRDQLAHEMRRVLEADPIDLLLLNKAPVELAYFVIAQGILLYQRDLVTRVEYEARIMSHYGDYLPVLRAQRDDILRGDEHGTQVQRYREALRRTERTLGEITAAKGQSAL